METLDPKPVIRALTKDEAEEMLTRHTVGRLAYSFHDRVDIEPIHYVYDAPWIFGRTSPGAKLLTLARNRWCALEIDEVLGLYEWTSVVVKGPFAPRDRTMDSWDYDRAVTALRRVQPNALTRDDPAPHRDIVFGIHASEITGRSSAIVEPDPTTL
jgi:nitroimidazol reductase NimA-like FMN-containing flavoprotein (pyridoxamine 5'-phosphate oxidase superfamily)